MNPQSPEPAEEHWTVYLGVIREARNRGIGTALGGGFAVAHYIHHREDTSDIDLYVLPEDQERMLAVLADCGLADYHEVEPYERHWRYRAHRDGVIVDIIWALPNGRAQVDPLWLSRGNEIDLHGETVRLLPPEELIWGKLYVLRHDRSDWPDILNLVHATAPAIDWDHLVARLEDDAPLLAAVLTLYGWLMPERAAQLPVLVEILARPSNRRHDAIPREDLLDARPWFHAEPEPATGP